MSVKSDVTFKDVTNKFDFLESDRKILIHPLNQKSDVSLLGQDSDFHGYLLSSFCVILPTNKHN